jgi:hypothetical protein
MSTTLTNGQKNFLVAVFPEHWESAPDAKAIRDMLVAGAARELLNKMFGELLE